MALSAIVNGTDGALSTSTDPRVLVMAVIITIAAADYATGVGLDLTTLQSGFATQGGAGTVVTGFTCTSVATSGGVRRKVMPAYNPLTKALQLYKIDAGATGDFIEVTSADLANNDKVTGILYMTQAG